MSEKESPSYGYLKTPWSVTQYGCVLDADGKDVYANGFATVCTYSQSQIDSKARTKFIVEAVNSHAAHKTHVINLDIERNRHAEARLNGLLVAAILVIGCIGLAVGAKAMAYQSQQMEIQ